MSQGTIALVISGVLAALRIYEFVRGRWWLGLSVKSAFSFGCRAGEVFGRGFSERPPMTHLHSNLNIVTSLWPRTNKLRFRSKRAITSIGAFNSRKISIFDFGWSVVIGQFGSG
jgi:hypothetical protein